MPSTPFAEGDALRHVPLIGGLLGASIVGIPISVTGKLQDPDVDLLGAGAVSRGLVDLMAATRKAPVELLDPILGQRRPAQAPAAPLLARAISARAAPSPPPRRAAARSRIFPPAP